MRLDFLSPVMCLAGLNDFDDLVLTHESDSACASCLSPVFYSDLFRGLLGGRRLSCVCGRAKEVAYGYRFVCRHSRRYSGFLQLPTAAIRSVRLSRSKDRPDSPAYSVQFRGAPS